MKQIIRMRFVDFLLARGKHVIWNARNKRVASSGNWLIWRKSARNDKWAYRKITSVFFKLSALDYISFSPWGSESFQTPSPPLHHFHSLSTFANLVPRVLVHAALTNRTYVVLHNYNCITILNYDQVHLTLSISLLVQCICMVIIGDIKAGEYNIRNWWQGASIVVNSNSHFFIALWFDDA
jgi:hypothetical protein